MNGRSITELRIGDTASLTKTITEADLVIFAGVTGDFNPVHLHREFAESTMFKARIAHGALSVGLISAVLGMQLPGPGAIYLSQHLRFLKPVYIGDSVTATVEVAEVLLEKNRVRFSTRCINQQGETVAEGESLLMPRREE